MLITPAKPACGLAIRNAFQYATIEMVDGSQYTLTHEERGGEMRFNFSENGSPTTLKHTNGDSVIIRNHFGEQVRLSLMPLWDDQLYEKFDIRAEGVEIEFEFFNLYRFQSELTRLMTLMSERLALWAKHQQNAAA